MHLLVPLALIANGLMMTTIRIGGVSLLWEALPESSNRPSYFAMWTACIHLSAAAGAGCGGLLASRLEGVEIQFMGLTLGNLHFIFLLTAALRLLPTAFLARVTEKKAQSVTTFLRSVFTGNAIKYALNSLAMNLFKSEPQRAKAAIGLAESGSPMAVADLIGALNDISPEVRRLAAEGLGQLKDQEAVPSLLDEMAEEESDIRAEAVAALGQIQHPLSLDALREGLYDNDPNVRVSAAKSLSQIGSDGVLELLFVEASTRSEPATFPVIIDALAEIGDVRCVKLVLSRYHEFESPIIQGQLLNSLTKALGGGQQFYQLAALERKAQIARIHGILDSAVGSLDSSIIDDRHKAGLQRHLANLRDCVDSKNISKRANSFREMATLFQSWSRESGKDEASVEYMADAVFGLADLIEGTGGHHETLCAIVILQSMFSIAQRPDGADWLS